MLYTYDHGNGLLQAKDPAVVRLGNVYFMYYTAFIQGAGESEKIAVAIAKSTDMENWEFVELMPLTEPYEKNGVGAPGAYVENGKVHLFYQTYGNGKDDCICHAVSNDGVLFEKDKSNPIFKPSESWCAGRAIDADVVVFEDKLFLYYATRDHEMKIQKIGCAYAPLGSDYSRKCWKEAVLAPVLEPEYAWEGECTEAPAAIVHNGKVYLFYGGSYNCTPQQIGYAVSDDGVHFSKPLKEPFLRCGNKGEWNECESGHPYVFSDDDGQVYLFYQGSPDFGKTWYLSKLGLEFDSCGQPKIKNNKTKRIPKVE